MKIIKLIPFILLIVGTLGLLATELSAVSESSCLTLTFASMNVIGLVVLVLTHRKEGKTNIKYLFIVIILAVIVGGGILIYQYWWFPKGEIKTPKEAEISEVDRKEIIIQNNKICLPFPKNAEKIAATIEQKLIQILLDSDVYVSSGDYFLPDTFVNIGVDFGEIVDLSDPVQLKMAERDATRIVHLDLISTFLKKYKDIKGYYPKTDGRIDSIFAQSVSHKELIKYVPEAFFMPEDPLGEGRWYKYESDGETFTLRVAPEIQNSRNEPAFYFERCVKNKKFGEYYVYVCEGK